MEDKIWGMEILWKLSHRNIIYVANTKKKGGGGRHENVRVLRKEIKKVVRWESG